MALVVTASSASHALGKRSDQEIQRLAPFVGLPPSTPRGLAFVGGLNRLRTIVELRSEYYALSNAFKTYFSIYLKPREGRYFEELH